MTPELRHWLASGRTMGDWFLEQHAQETGVEELYDVRASDLPDRNARPTGPDFVQETYEDRQPDPDHR